MINKIKSLILGTAALLAFAAPALVPASAYAATNSSITNNLACGTEFNLNTVDDNGCQPGDSNANFTTLVKKIINIFSIIVGVIAVVMIIVGGLKYITSGGESSNVSGAKNTIIYAIVGLIIVALAQFIVRFVLSNASNI